MNITSELYQKLPLYCIHDCACLASQFFGDTACQTEIRLSEDGEMYLDLNPYYNLRTRTCSNNGSLSSGIVHLESYDMNNPKCLGGVLFYPTLQIIPDTIFRIKIVFPLARPIFANVKTEQPLKLYELIQLVKDIYIQIYKDEQETATPTSFEFKTECGCIQDPTLDSTPLPYDEKNECSICFMNEPTYPMISLKCKHTFHSSCISMWGSKGGKTCPLCRRTMNECAACGNTGEIVSVEEYVELPIERRVDQTRPATDGAYGIYGHYFEDLYLSGLKYNRQTKTLRVSVVFY